MVSISIGGRVNIVTCEIVEPQVFARKTQQTPNPEAQFPAEFPELSEHSVLVMQVPWTEESVAEVQAAF